MTNLNILYLVFSMLLFISVIGSTLSARSGIPLLVLFLVIGMLAGEEGIIGIRFNQFFFANLLGQAALAVILLDGGLRTSLTNIRIAYKPALPLATWGVIATAVISGLFITWILAKYGYIEKGNWRYGMLMASIVGSTDAAAVFSLLRNGGVRLNARVQSTLEVESGANDPMAILLVTAFISLNLHPEEQNLLSFSTLLITQFALGILIGLTSGYLLARLLQRLHLPEGMYAILIFSAGILTFSMTNLLGGSGFLAVFIAGIVIGNHHVRATEHVLRVMDGMAWLSQAVLFVMLGLLITPSQVVKILPLVAVISLFLIFIARPLAVISVLIFCRFNPREIGFISWVGLRGAVPITLAIIPIMENVPNARFLFDLTFGVVIISLVLQGMTLPFAAELFKVKIPPSAHPSNEHEIWVGDRASIRIYEFNVKKGAFGINQHPDAISRRLGEEEIRLFALVRQDKVEAVTPQTKIRVGDRLWYAVNGDHAHALAVVLNDTYVTRQQRNEFFGEWVISSQVVIADLSLLEEVDLPEEERKLTASELFHRRLGENIVVGDHIELGDRWFLTVRETDQHGQISAIGLKLDTQAHQKSSEPLPAVNNSAA
ncbi:potassium/proton antiporter [Dichelobacter nodosus]|uniref:Sodium/hydrogen exchanger n=1 Tax=Dichelobacter nodosus (strain VCS1703A) TaxID=246195 RepID=A5EXJ1_DICNV|nr:potassium/proton antiporter [Dichelobacter nodosus]ABQ14160.1 Sodium/hydrogen exchanger [Dichelobacter nodosus VCS1703A]AXM45932.1 potassium/proton antiporter [Dichelobacter nodosus]KNZ39097.1 potassium transporter [Dichelobacter nodosus]TGA64615.1 potassium/proton antiporter [Dichelobacter nodosus]